MLHPRSQAHLPHEAGSVLRLSQQAWAHHLDRYRTVAEILVVRQPDLAHAARAQQPVKPVPPAKVRH
jgi:hypothetical protein